MVGPRIIGRGVAATPRHRRAPERRPFSGYNGFLENGAYNSLELPTDGEAIDVVNYVEDNSAYGVDAIDFVHFMM